MSKSGLFIVIDGIAGSGKTTILNHVKDMVTQSNLRAFDSQEWYKNHDSIPLFSEIDNYDVYFTIEPTKAWIGSSIRNEIAFNGDEYKAIEQAHAFSLDRHMQYRRLIVPAIKAGKIIIQDRSVSTSIVYQGHMDDTINQEEVMKLPGNTYAIKHAPDHLVLTYIDPDTAQARQRERAEMSKGIYEDMEKLIAYQNIFHSEEFQSIFTATGTSVHSIDTGTALEETLHQSELLFKKLISIK